MYVSTYRYQNKLWPMYMQVGFCYVLAMLLSNAALFFINYPTQVMSACVRVSLA